MESIALLLTTKQQQKRPRPIKNYLKTRPIINQKFHNSLTAFDTLDHDQILQRAADEFGLCARKHDWLKSYLSGRSSYVSFAGFYSPGPTIDSTTGVTQGSVLGPLLFSLFTTPVG